MKDILPSIAKQEIDSEDAVWLGHCDALYDRGLEDVASSLDKIADDPSVAEEMVQTARQALAVLGHIAKEKGVPQKAVTQAADPLKRIYGSALQLVLATKNIGKEDERHASLRVFTTVHFSCRAYADALREFLNHENGDSSPPPSSRVQAKKL